MAKANDVIAAIVAQLYQEKADNWSVQEKGRLLAAVKLAVTEKARETARRMREAAKR